MATVVSYERPSTIDEALALLLRPGTIALGGGTKVNAAPTAEPVAIVDLQALGLDRIEPLGGHAVRVGATATLQELAEHAAVPAAVREAARRELPSTLRAAATVGGCVATADPESELLAALLVHEAKVGLAGRDGVPRVELDALLGDLGLLSGALVTAVEIETTGASGVARTARTPADRAIVAAAARRSPAGERLLALTGVGARPMLVTDIDGLEPRSDFRGSAEYRRALAVTLAARALEAVG
jgi:probable selenate reductase FAD-binding subunit